LSTVLEKLKALDAQRAQLLEGAKKEALENAEKAVAELNELGFHYTLTEGASAPSTTSPARAARKSSSKPQGNQAPKERRSLPYLLFQNAPLMMAGCTGHRRPRSHSVSRNSWKGILRRFSFAFAFGYSETA
jgi:hypothetical protein